MEINKDLIAASSTPLVLAILAEEDSYGYAILQRVRELSGGRMEWTDGMLYPVLHRLDRLGHVEARWEVVESGRRRKYYRITSQGRARLAEEREQWKAVNSTLQGIWRALSIPGPANHAVSAAPLPQGHKAYRFAVGVALAAVFLLVWMNAAVGGILGDDPANMMYFGVLLVGFVGAVIARLEPQGMSR